MNIPSIEDTNRYTAPPEPRSEGRWDEPEDHPDYLDQFSDEPEPEKEHMKTIKKICKRHSFGCFTVEDIKGDFYIIELCFKLEELWQQNNCFRIEEIMEKNDKINR